MSTDKSKVKRPAQAGAARATSAADDRTNSEGWVAAGLGPAHHWVRIGASDRSKAGTEALKAAIRSKDPRARLAVVESRAEAYANDEVLTREIRTVKRWLSAPSDITALAIPTALLALERGLDLLDTGVHIKALVRDSRATQSQLVALKTALKQREELIEKDLAKVAEAYSNLLPSQRQREATALIARQTGLSKHKVLARLKTIRSQLKS